MQILSKTVILNSKTIPNYTKLDTVLYLPYLKEVRHKLQRLHIVDRGYEEKNAAFTLAETLITLTILGVVAAITVPSLINKQTESANRTKVKKAMASYEKALNQMLIDTDAKGALSSETGYGSDCSKSTEYFKKIAGSGCRFQTADRIWWDITDISHPIISLKDEITAANAATIKTNATSLEKDKTSFAMVGYRDSNGVLRVNDLGYEQANYTDNRADLVKLYSFMQNQEIEINVSQQEKIKEVTDKIKDIIQNRRNLPQCYDNQWNRINSDKDCAYSNPGASNGYIFTADGGLIDPEGGSCYSGGGNDPTTYSGQPCISVAFGRTSASTVFRGCDSGSDISSCTICQGSYDSSVGVNECNSLGFTGCNSSGFCAKQGQVIDSYGYICESPTALGNGTTKCP